MYYSRFIVVCAVFIGIALSATPVYAIERGTGSYIDYLILKMQSEGASAPVRTSVTPATETPTSGGAYSFQPVTPNAIVSWLQSVRTISIPTVSGGSSFGGGSSIDVTTYHLIGDTNEGVQNTRGIVD
ncbi:hypothetical protein K2Y00_02525 [Patescibacteria group bacterium]|nr:hypothetical protein [Patescibacteria group bacterium]